MADIKKLIEELSRDTAKKPVFRPGMVFLKWEFFSVIYGIMVLRFIGLRPDIGQAITNHFYVSELALLLMILIFSLFSCVNLALPDINQKKHLLHLTLIPLAALVLIWGIEFLMQKEELAGLDMGGLNCTTCITLAALIPAAFLFHEVRKAAPTRLRLAGFFCLVYSGALGSFILRLSEPQDSVIHLLVWHYIPVILIGLLGSLIGKKMFKW